MSEPSPRSGITPWPLSTPESAVLLWGPDIHETYPLRYGLLELVARGYLAPVTGRREYLWGAVTRRHRALARPHARLTTGDVVLDSLLNRIPGSILGFVDKRPIGEVADNILHRQVIHRPYRRRDGTRESLTGYGWQWLTVLPALARRGYYSPGAIAVADHPETWRWAVTPQGVDALIALRRMMQEGRDQFGEWVTNEPGRAWAYLDRAGSAALLVTGLSGHVRRLVAADPARLTAWHAPPPEPGEQPLPPSVIPPPWTPLDAFLRTRPDGDLDDILAFISHDVDQAWIRLQRRASVGGSGE